MHSTAMWLAAAFVGVTSACAAPVPVVKQHADPDPPVISDPLEAPFVLSIAQPATAYNESFVAPPPTPLGDAVRAAMRGFAGTRGEITGDPRLDLACSEIAAVVSRDAAPSAALVEFVLHSHGIAEQAARVFTAWTAPVPDLVTAVMRPQFGDVLLGRVRAGVGSAPSGPVIAIVVHATGVDLVATPRAVAAHGGFELAATLDPRVESPQVIISHEDGTIERPAVVIDADGSTFRASFACGEHTGRQWIEIDATGLGGTLPRVVAPILCGETWPSSFAVEPPANLTRLTTTADIERRLTSIINRQRARAQLPLLRTDARLAASAHERATSVRDARAAGVEPVSTSPIERLRRAGMNPLVLVENALEVDSVGHAAEELMNDATFRAHVESPTSTDIGVGVARDDASGRLFITITYAAMPPRIDAPMVARCIAEAINTLYGARVDVDLNYVAQQSADRLASGYDVSDLQSEILTWLASITHGKYHGVSFSTAKVVDVARIDPREMVHGRSIRGIGVGVAQTPRYDTHDGGATWVVVLQGNGVPRWWQFDDIPEETASHACLSAATGR